MKILDFDFDLDNGFAWIIVEGGPYIDSKPMTVQCYLYQPEGKPTEQKINMSDCGEDWGICGDVNKPAFDYWGHNRCMSKLFHYADKAGIELI